MTVPSHPIRPLYRDNFSEAPMFLFHVICDLHISFMLIIIVNFMTTFYHGQQW